MDSLSANVHSLEFCTREDEGLVGGDNETAALGECKCVCVFTCVDVHVGARDQPSVSSSITVHLDFLRQGLLLLFGTCLLAEAVR